MSMSTSEYLTFAIAGQDYGAAILAVREIRGWTAETPLPNAPAGVRGIINLRGQVVPIFDLRVRLGAAATPPTATHEIGSARVGKECVSPGRSRRSTYH